MDYRIVERPLIKIVGLKYYGNNKNNEIGAMCEEFYTKRVAEIKNRINYPTSYGYDTWTNEINENGKFTYIAGVEVSDNSQIPEGMDYIEIPANKYAIFTINNLSDKKVKEIYKKWLPHHNLKMNSNYDFEYYDIDEKGAPAYFHIPIE